MAGHFASKSPGAASDSARTEYIQRRTTPDGAAPFFVPGRTKTGAVMSASSDPIRILTVDDHPLLRAGIEALVSSQVDMLVVAVIPGELPHSDDGKVVI